MSRATSARSEHANIFWACFHVLKEVSPITVICYLHNPKTFYEFCPEIHKPVDQYTVIRRRNIGPAPLSVKGL